MTETLAHGYSSECTLRELSNECQHDRVQMVFKNLSILVLRTRVASALEGFLQNFGVECKFSMCLKEHCGLWWNKISPSKVWH